MSTEKTCILQVGYDFTYSLPHPPKTIRICGFIHSVESTAATAFVKEINYTEEARTFGNIQTKTDSDLVKTLEKFDCVIVADSQAAEFISSYVKPTTQLVVLQKIFKSKDKSKILGDVTSLRTNYLRRYLASEHVQRWIRTKSTKQ